MAPPRIVGPSGSTSRPPRKAASVEAALGRLSALGPRRLARARLGLRAAATAAATAAAAFPLPSPASARGAPP